VLSMGRPWSPLGVRLAFWEGLDAGLSVAASARAAGVSRPTAYRWLSDHRKVLSHPVQDFSVPRAGLLSLAEREEIGFQLARGQGVRRIAAVLGRAPSTISREVARNQVSDRYVPSLAQEQTWARARRPRARKLDGLALRERVRSMLTDRFSPEQVSGRLRVEHPEDPQMQVSHETIYQALYVQGRGSLRLEIATALRSGRVIRRQQRPEGPRPQRFREMVMISDRPPEIEDRAVPGHWEGDLIIGSTASRSAIGTLVERTSGCVMLLHLPGDHTAGTVADAMITAMKTLPEQLRRSMTWDQGWRCPSIRRSRWRPGCRSTSATRTHRGNAAATRTPMGCCENISRKARTCPSTGPGSSRTSPPNSTADPENATATSPQQKSSPR
jgi:IS30 family transposase